MSHRIALRGILLALALAAGATAASAGPQDFVKQAGAAGLYELRAAEIARDKAQRAEVREFADEMMNDHRTADQELRSLAKKRSWTMPAALEPKHQQLIDRLGNLEGPEFEREYAKQQLQAHKEVVALFKEQAERGTDPELKVWATGKVPTLQAHLEHAQALEDSATTRPPRGAMPDDRGM